MKATETGKDRYGYFLFRKDASRDKIYHGKGQVRLSSNSLGKKIASGVLSIVLMGFLAKFASFIAEAVLAAYLGASYQSDAYYMVSGIHDVLYPMLSVGIWKVFLPLYKAHNTLGETDDANRLADKTISVFTIVSAIFCVLLFLFADVAVSVIAPGFTGETRALCIRLVRISAPMYVFIVASSVYASMLQSRSKFMASQIRQTVSHIPTILGAVFLYRCFGVEALAVMLVLGGVVRLIVELPFVNWDYKYRPTFGKTSDEFGLLLKRLPSAVISEGVVQLNTLVDKVMASTFAAGAVTCLNYGSKLMNVFSGLLSSAIATSTYPQMVELLTKKKEKELQDLLLKLISIFAILMIPVSMGCALYRTELVSVVFERGNFDSNSVMMTSGVFSLYCISLFFAACNEVLTNIFYAAGDTRSPMYISIFNLVINVILNLTFSYFMGVFGLALATSCSAVMTYFLRIAYIQKVIVISQGAIMKKMLLIMALSCISCVPVYALVNGLFHFTMLRLAVGVALTCSIYYILLKLMRVEEIEEVTEMVMKKISKKKAKY